VALTSTLLVAARAYLPDEVEGPVAIALRKGQITAVWRVSNVEGARARARAELGADSTVVDLGERRVAPGYIDIHTHGLVGYDLTTGSSADAAAMAAALPSTGVTAFLPTVASIGRGETVRQIQRLLAAGALLESASAPAAELLGIRLEGPFISHQKRGAQLGVAIRPPDTDELHRLVDLGGGRIRIVDFAPEEDSGLQLLAALVGYGVVAAIGHTAASYSQTLAALEGGARHGTHLFNAMSALDHRSPGAAGALLTDQRATVEVIADGIHVHPAVLRLIVRMRGVDHVAVITDAISAAGMPAGVYAFVQRPVSVRDGAVRLEDGTLAGSALTMDRGVVNLVGLVGLGWADAIRMATLTPANIVGVGHRKGRIAAGYDADLVVLDARGRVSETWVRGRRAFVGDA
jgi:N-acetylglucosamine-6-phosphate deacetylase